MQEVVLDEGDQAFEAFRNKLNKYLDYLHYLQTVKADKLTQGEREILESMDGEKRHERK
jgi:hypothetical protein